MALAAVSLHRSPTARPGRHAVTCIRVAGSGEIAMGRITVTAGRDRSGGLSSERPPPSGPEPPASRERRIHSTPAGARGDLADDSGAWCETVQRVPLALRHLLHRAITG